MNTMHQTTTCPRCQKICFLDVDRRPARRPDDAPALPAVTGGAVLEPAVPVVSRGAVAATVRACTCRPVAIPLQDGGELGLQPDRAGYVVLTAVDVFGDAVSVLLNDEELGLLHEETGGVR